MLIETDRLILRPWENKDEDAFIALNADPDVMRYFPALLSPDLSRDLMNRIVTRSKEDGFCFMPVEDKASGLFLGFAGLSRPRYASTLPFEPCVEIGWRFHKTAWGQGFATEAARAWLRFGFETLDLKEIVSFAPLMNKPSQRVMQRVGMICNSSDNFFHPALEETDPLGPHVLYRLAKRDWGNIQVSSV